MTTNEVCWLLVGLWVGAVIRALLEWAEEALLETVASVSQPRKFLKGHAAGCLGGDEEVGEGCDPTCLKILNVLADIRKELGK